MKLGNVFSDDVKRKGDDPILPKVKVINLHYTKLHRSVYQYRDHSDADVQQLAELIMADGKVLQPLKVRRIGGDDYEILVGHCRHAACKYLVEQGMEQFAFLPCTEEQVSEQRAEFMVYSSNRFTPKTAYEEMREIEGMIQLLKEHPEEFPEAGNGRTVEKLSRLLGQSQTKIKEYQSITHNLVSEGKEALREGTINKSTAYQLARLSAEEQKKHLERPEQLNGRELRKVQKGKSVSESDTVDSEPETRKKENPPTVEETLAFYPHDKQIQETEAGISVSESDTETSGCLEREEDGTGRKNESEEEKICWCPACGCKMPKHFSSEGMEFDFKFCPECGTALQM